MAKVYGFQHNFDLALKNIQIALNIEPNNEKALEILDHIEGALLENSNLELEEDLLSEEI